MKHTLALAFCLLLLFGCSDPASESAAPQPDDTIDAGQDVPADEPPEMDEPDADPEPDPTPDVEPGIETVESWTEPCNPDAPEFRLMALPTATLHVACQGSGPTILLLHGFPEFWFGWSKVASKLAEDYRVVMPDQRGYNLSDKPEGLENYTIDPLVGDIDALIDAISDEPILLVGHDWGGAVAWGAGHLLADKLTGLVILNGPHPNIFAREYIEDEAQNEASAYVRAILNDGIEASLAANDYAFLAGAMGGLLSDEELALYIEAWSQPGALTAMLAWYRANFNEDGPDFGDLEVTIEIPTLVLWGLADTALLPGNIEGLDEYVTDLDLQTFEGVGHFIAHEIPDEVAEAIAAFQASL